jgi:hypothetical protein
VALVSGPQAVGARSNPLMHGTKSNGLNSIPGVLHGQTQSKDFATQEKAYGHEPCRRHVEQAAGNNKGW